MKLSIVTLTVASLCVLQRIQAAPLVVRDDGGSGVLGNGVASGNDALNGNHILNILSSYNDDGDSYDGDHAEQGEGKGIIGNGVASGNHLLNGNHILEIGSHHDTKRDVKRALIKRKAIELARRGDNNLLQQLLGDEVVGSLGNEGGDGISEDKALGLITKLLDQLTGEGLIGGDDDDGLGGLIKKLFDAVDKLLENLKSKSTLGSLLGEDGELIKRDNVVKEVSKLVTGVIPTSGQGQATGNQGSNTVNGDASAGASAPVNADPSTGAGAGANVGTSAPITPKQEEDEGNGEELTDHQALAVTRRDDEVDLSGLLGIITGLIGDIAGHDDDKGLVNELLKTVVELLQDALSN